MKITVLDVERVALHSRLELSEQEKKDYVQSLNDILDYLEVLNRVDTSNVEPTAHVLPLKNVYRADELSPGLVKEAAMANAPEIEDGCFKVPRIV